MEMVLMLVVMIGIFYFLLIRPENKRKKEAENLRSSLKAGDKVNTIGGIVGTVVSVKETTFVIEVGADQVRIEFEKWALSTNITATENAKAEAKKREEAKARAKAEKKSVPASQEKKEKKEKKAKKSKEEPADNQ